MSNVKIKKGAPHKPPPAGVKKTSPGAPAASAAVLFPSLPQHTGEETPLGPSRAALFETPGAPFVTPDGILSNMPLSDLGQIKTDGRSSTGFRLDGGSVRLLWINVRRINDPANKQGFEINLFAEGAAIARLRKRMQEKGATKSTSFPFYAGDPHPDAPPGLGTLMRTGPSWSPSSTEGLILDVEGKYTVHFIDAKPQALRGALRICTYGNDEASTKSLQEVINKLGLHAIFAPSKPQALERFKLARLLWSTEPSAIDSLRYRSAYDLSTEALEAALEAAGVPPEHADRKALEAVDLAKDPLAQRLKYLDLLLEKGTKSFIDWAKSDTYYSKQGILPNNLSGTDSGVLALLKKQGFEADAQKVKERGAPSAENAKKLLLLGLLIKKAPAAADELLSVDLETIKIEDLRKLVEAQGFDPLGSRVQGLKFEEVYPGYFTILDPARPAELFELGARYLYSTADNPERVHSMLTSGQKSSFTRFQEGLLIQGKSSDADFNTGGAFSVFSRLVTRSVIAAGKREKAKKPKSSSAYLPTTFYNWGGSRPYKLIINRRILARLDWYGYNGDNFGRTTGLTTDNHGKNVVAAIEKSYVSSNELMFAVGNDPRFVDYVACETDAQKKSLIEFLKSKGIESFAGKALEDFVRVESNFFEHPDDQTFEQALLDAVELLDTKAAIEVAQKKVKKVAEEAAQEAAEKEAKAKLPELLAPAVLESAKGSFGWEQNQKLNPIAEKFIKALDVSLFEPACTVAAQEAAKEGISALDTSSYESQTFWSLDNKIRSELNKLVSDAVLAPVKAAATAVADSARSSTLAGAEEGTTKEALAAAVREAVRPLVQKTAKAAVLEILLAIDRTTFEEQAKKEASSNWRSYLSTAAQGQLHTHANSISEKLAAEGGWPQSLCEQFLDAQGKELTKGAKKGVKANLSKNLGHKLREPAREAAKKAALPLCEALVAEGVAKLEESVKETIQKAAESFNEQHPDKAETLDAAREAKVLASGRELLSADVRRAIEEKANELASKLSEDIIKDVAKSAGVDDQAALIQQAITEWLDARVKDSLRSYFWQRVAEPMRSATSPLIQARLDEMLAQLVPKLLESAVARLAEEVAQGRSYNLANELANAAYHAVITGA